MKTKNKTFSQTIGSSVFFKKIVFACFLFIGSVVYADNDILHDDEKLLDELILSNKENTIIFDKNNIKQYWIDKCVISRKNGFDILLTKKNNLFESIPLKIQLANVNEALDCKVEVITENSDVIILVTNSKAKTIAQSASKESFIHYKINSASFHLEDTQNSSFNLVFSSKTADMISIKRVILSFLTNSNSTFLASPGTIKLTGENMIASNSNTLVRVNTNNGFILNGVARLNKKILVTDNTFRASLKIKNINSSQAHIYVGFIPYAQDGTLLRRQNYINKGNNTILEVVSSKDDSNRIVVTHFTKREDYSVFAINVKEDMSDIPNFNISSEEISEIIKKENGEAEIILNKPLKKAYKTGTKLRIHNNMGGYIYLLNYETINPGEENRYEYTIAKDNNFLEYSPKAFPKGTYYVVPVIISDNDVLFSDYVIAY